MHALKRYSANGALWALMSMGLGAALVVGCTTTTPTTPVSPAQQALNLTAQTCKDNNAAIVAADSAVKANVLKGQDARNALAGLTAIQTACASTLASLQGAAAAPAPATTGATK